MDFSKIKQKIKNFWSNLDKFDKLVILLLFVSFLIRIIVSFYSSFRGWDETVYLNLGRDLSNNPLIYSLKNVGWSDYIPSADTIYGWPNIGFRAPLLPYIFSIFYFFKLDFFIPVVIPFITTLSILLVYILGKKLFNKNVGLYSAVVFSLIPIHIYCSGKIWTDAFVVFFMLLTFISFWEGYENNNKRHKILFGLFLALSLLARYTTLWITPVFLFYFIFRDKSFRFLGDKYLWYSIFLFFVTLIPWFIYGLIYYGNPFGGFIHGFKAAMYWGGVQSWTYFIDNSWRIFSIAGLFFIASLFFVFFKKQFLKKEVYLLLIWFFFFSFIVISMPHKEDRFIMPVVPVISLIIGFFISKIGQIKNIVFSVLCIVLAFSSLSASMIEYRNSKDLTIECYKEGNKFLNSDMVRMESLVITNQNPMTHYYTNKDILIYPEPWRLDSFRNIIDSKYQNKDIYMFFANYDMTMDSLIKKDLDANFNKVYECQKGYGYSAIYKYK